MLEEMFQHQAELDKRIADTELVDAECTAEAGFWLNNYSIAISSRLSKLRLCLQWQPDLRPRYILRDRANARKEIVVLLAHCISLARVVDLNAEEVFELHQQHLGAQHTRLNNRKDKVN